MDIKSSLQEISAAGMSDAEIGAVIGAPQSIVTRLRNGVHKTTSWERGQAIVALAERLRKASPAEPSSLEAAAGKGARQGLQGDGS